MKLTNSHVLGVCLIVAASVVTASSSYADTETLSACVKKSNGAARIISGKMKCAKTERLVTWTSTSDSLIGPAGATGATGATGAAGAKGERGLTGPVGLTGAAGVNGLDGRNGRDGVDGTNGLNGLDGLDGAQGLQGIQGVKGDTGATGASGISKALVASGTTVYINQGSESTVLSATIPAGKYVMDLSASLSYSNSEQSMFGDAYFACYISKINGFTPTSGSAPAVLWPDLNNASPFRMSFENHSASSDEILRRSFAASSTLTLNDSTTVHWVCRHYSLITDDATEKVIIRYPRIILTAVDEITTLN